MQPLASQSHARFPLSRILASSGSVRVLRALCMFGGPLSVSQIAQDAAMTPQGVRITLDSLAGQQIVSALGQRRSMLYEINARHPMASSLRALFADELAQWEGILRSLRHVIGKFRDIEAAWYYGSVARGEDGPSSDLDIAIVVSGGDIDAVTEAVRDALHEAPELSTIACSVVAVPMAEISTMAKESAWWQEVAVDAKILKGKSPDSLLRHLRHAA